jgi:1,4-dihydroxy-2-naphthoate polyprenyltransferase
VTTAAQWWEGARPRTLGLAVAPVAVGTAAGAMDDGLMVGRAALAAIVAIALQIGVNYANDYSDGVRGTDADRRGPLRLTASGTAAPGAVKRAAFLSFGVAAVAGGILSLIVNPWLLLLGVVAIAAAWGYTGGSKPYGYSGWGEVAVLAFFGFAACAGSAYVQHAYVPAAAWWGSLVIGLPACAVLLVNNIRDIPGDTVAGKRTLAVRVGAPAARRLFVGCLVLALVAIIPIVLDAPWAALAFLAAPLAVPPSLIVLSGESAPPQLVAALVATVRFAVVTAVLLTVGLALS